jgi:hypothetical protein
MEVVMKKKKERKLKKYFEAILGRNLGLEVSDEVALREHVGSYTKEEGATTSRDIGTTGSARKGCAAADLLDVSGRARTGDDGSTEFMLSDFFCDFSGQNRLEFQYPVNFIATPLPQTPVFLTGVATLTSDRRDVKIRVTTWDPSGSPAPVISFDWRCRVPYVVIEG